MINVFIADDHAILRDGLRALIDAQPDLRVVGDAGDGRAALAQIASLQPDVAVVDFAMPGLNGLELCARVCDKKAAERVPAVIILSMFGTAEHVYRALRAGARGYLHKESAGEELLAAIRAVFGGQRCVGRTIPAVAADLFVRGSAAAGSKSPLERLSRREREVLQLVVEGHSSVAIGALINLSPKTVDTYRARIMNKLGLRDLAGLVKFAIQHGLTVG